MSNVTERELSGDVGEPRPGELVRLVRRGHDLPQPRAVEPDEPARLFENGRPGKLSIPPIASVKPRGI